MNADLRARLLALYRVLAAQPPALTDSVLAHEAMHLHAGAVQVLDRFAALGAEETFRRYAFRTCPAYSMIGLSTCPVARR